MPRQCVKRQNFIDTDSKTLTFLRVFLDAECPANTFCNVDGTCRQVLVNVAPVQGGSGAQTNSAVAAEISIGMATIFLIPTMFL
jgi:hypothetical protein